MQKDSFVIDIPAHVVFISLPHMTNSQFTYRGVDNIDVKAATSCGIIVVNSPAGNILAAAEHTIALLLATARNVGKADAGVKAGKWERGKLVGVEVGSKTLGIVGLGKVGMEVARMAIGLGMKVSQSLSGGRHGF